MHVPITINGKRHIVTTDPNQFILNTEAQRDGSVELRPVGYYNSLSALCAAILRKKVLASDAQTLQEVRAAIERAEAEIISELSFDRRGETLANRIAEKSAA